jgi:hypothetical protein
MMREKLNMEKIAKGLHAERKGRVFAKSGYFGAMQLLSEVKRRFRTPERGGRSTDPKWTERRLVPLAPRTLRRLESISGSIRKHKKVTIEPMQLAAILLEKTTQTLTDADVEELISTSDSKS